VLAEAGYFPTSELNTLRKFGSRLEGHPNMRTVPGVEASTGSLGQGLSIGIGHALAARLDRRDYHVFVMTGDGEIDEGQVWEAALAATHFKLSNLTLIVNHNGYQQTAAVEQVLNTRPIAPKFASFGWESSEIDGHDLVSVHEALSSARAGDGAPRCIVARTVKGKGVSFIEGKLGTHGKALTPDEAKRALAEIG
jgi:transketolase